MAVMGPDGESHDAGFEKTGSSFRRHGKKYRVRGFLGAGYVSSP